MTDFLITNGIPKDAIIWIFMLPIAATLVVIARQIIGIKGFGLSMPLLLGFALAATGVKLGILIVASILGAGYLIRLVLNSIRLLYLPKTALIITGATMVIIISAFFLPYGKQLEFPLALFPLIVIVLSLEQFYTFLAERGLKKTVGIVLETLALSMLIAFTIEWEWLQQKVLAYPLITTAVVIGVNVFLGRWTGLRLSEYIRFKDIIFLSKSNIKSQISKIK